MLQQSNKSDIDFIRFNFYKEVVQTDVTHIDVPIGTICLLPIKNVYIKPTIINRQSLTERLDISKTI